MRRRAHIGLLVLLAGIPFLLHINGSMEFEPHHYYTTDERLTADVNLERYYIVEEDLLSNIEALLRDDYFEAADGESKEEHEKHKPDLSPVKNAINRTKAIHNEASRDMTGFLSHPVNVFHLLRRLDTDWKRGLDVVLQTKLCRQWQVPGMVRHLRYVRKRLPSTTELDSVVNFLTNQLKSFGPRGKEVVSGQVGDHEAFQPLTAEDQFVIAQSLYEQERFQSALLWLELVNDWFTKANQDDREDLGFNMSSVFKMMATAYNEVKKPAASVIATEGLLKIDPSNGVAKSNLAYFKSKAERQKAKGDDSDRKTPTRKTKYELLCSGKVPKVSRHTCVLERSTPHRGWSFHKKEILRRNPSIVLYHDVISKETADQLRDYSFNTMSDRAWTSDAFRIPRLRLLYNYAYIYPLALRSKARRTAKALRRLPRRYPLSLKSWGPLQAFTSGLQGMHLADYKDKLDLVPLSRKEEKQVGAFFLFLSEAKQGGQVVMPSRNLVIEPTKGSVLYYHPTSSKPHSYCPAIGASVWTLVQQYYNTDPMQCSPRPWLR